MRPIDSATKQRWEAAADCLIESSAPTALFRAVSAPMLSSLPGRLLSIEAGTQMIGILKAG